MPHVFITGAAGGLGRHLVGAWSRRGWRVTATDLDGHGLAAIGRQDGWSRNVIALAHDVTDPARWQAAWDEAVARNGAVDILVNNAGFLAPDWVTAQTARDVNLHVDVNVKGVVHGCRTAVAAMVPAGRGHIVNIGSLASLSPVPGLSLYAASKFAVRGYSLSIAVELAERGVAVTVVMPDAIATPMLTLQETRDEAALTFSGGRVLSPADIEAVLDDVFLRRPLEVSVPRQRGALAKAAALVPSLGIRLAPFLRRIGATAQAKRRR